MKGRAGVVFWLVAFGLGVTHGLSPVGVSTALAQQTTLSKQCSNCGKDVPLNSKAGDQCPHCGVRWGYESNRTQTPQSETKPLNRKQKDALWQSAIFFVVALAVGVGILIYRDKKLAVQTCRASHENSPVVPPPGSVKKVSSPEMIQATPVVEEAHEARRFFESDVPSGDGRCSDNQCPCPEAAIPRGTGYLYVDQRLVDLRRKYPTMKAVDEAAERRQRRASAAAARHGASFRLVYRPGPILVCEQGAKLRGLDLRVAAADAKRWWASGMVPLRVTPLASKKRVRPNLPDKAKLLANIKILVAVASADGKISPQKLDLLQSLCKKLGLNSNDLEKLIAGWVTVKRNNMPKSKREKQILLTKVFKMTATGGIFDDAERRMIGKIASGLGLTLDEVEVCSELAKRQKETPQQGE